MKEFHVKINQNGRVVIPMACRRALGVQQGDELIIRVTKGHEAHLSTLKKAVADARQLVGKYTAKTKTSLSKSLIKERRQEGENE